MKSGVVESAFRQTTDQRHLPAFKTQPNTATRPRLLTFVAFPTGFAVTGTFATTQALDPVSRARTWTQIMQANHTAVSLFPSPPRIPRTFRISSRRRNARSASTVAFTTFA